MKTSNPTAFVVCTVCPLCRPAYLDGRLPEARAGVPVSDGCGCGTCSTLLHVPVVGAASKETLDARLTEFKHSVTVEAEYGDEVSLGSLLTMAHHGPRAGAKAPCTYPNDCMGDRQRSLLEVVGVSHVDLDTLGGVMAALGVKPEEESFWNLAEFVDINGPHKLGLSGASPQDLDRLHAWWAWMGTDRAPRIAGPDPVDVTAYVRRAMAALIDILEDDERLLEAGAAWAAEAEALNESSFLAMEGLVVVRVADRFTNHLYTTPLSEGAALAVAAYNTTSGAITLSLADPIEGVSAAKILQGIFGDLAGGHATIAGSPRGVRQPLHMLMTVAAAAAMSIGPLVPTSPPLTQAEEEEMEGVYDRLYKSGDAPDEDDGA